MLSHTIPNTPAKFGVDLSKQVLFHVLTARNVIVLTLLKLQSAFSVSLKSARQFYSNLLLSMCSSGHPKFSYRTRAAFMSCLIPPQVRCFSCSSLLSFPFDHLTSPISVLSLC